MNTPSPIVRFSGPVRWEAGPGHAGITLLGEALEADGSCTAAQLSLSCLETPELPSAWAGLTVEAAAMQHIILRSAAQEWRVRCSTWQLHRDIGALFFAAVPPRRMPWSRRLTWRVLLGIAATAPGRWLLARRGRAK